MGCLIVSTAAGYMHGSRKFRVISVVTVVMINGHERRFTRGQLLPSSVGQALIDHLLRIRHIEEEAS